MIEPVELPQYLGYKIFRNGNIIGPMGRILKPGISGNGYHYIRIHLHGKPTNRYVHRLVAAAYLGLDILDSSIPIDHKDKYKSNNDIDNLEIVTHGENNSRKNAYLYDKDTLTHKVCKECGLLKLKSEFYKNPSVADGLYYKCKRCVISKKGNQK